MNNAIISHPFPEQHHSNPPPRPIPNPATTCHAEKTFHHFCGHITTTYTQHSPLCSASQNQDAPNQSRPGSSGSGSGSGSTGPRSSTLTQTLTRTVSQSATSAVEALTDLARRFTVQSTNSREIPITSLEFSFAARVPCLQVVDEPLYDPAPCKRCAESMGLGEGENAESERVMTEREEEEWVRRRVKVEADMREWVVRMNDWDGGVRVLRRDVD
ncbi:615c76e1-8e50-4f3c-9f92-b60a882ba6f8-CDS [Sclerotinia trifoliorum]|uniref:615c76e1-8e50-4f3c-9f92-b60a882ba6f8-CDS n=1 Tax=Sclerotinia trifoliorum TaxID=28548 RepID=A0A8H2ZTP1_9HELO|nr:615c76e1-8e50-4f3c-9f92-b60a882ba6f8-CDS [Sclerotinia trifoliorum]